MENEFVFRNKKVLVTGGTGFIGKALVRSLVQEGASVTCLTRRADFPQGDGVRYIQFDLREIERLGKEIIPIIGEMDVIVYLAASIPLLTENKESLVDAKKNTLDVFVDFLNIFGCLSDRIVFTSTVDIYGSGRGEVLLEDTLPMPSTPYAIAKLCCEEYLKYYCRMNDKRFSILRLAQVYGPHEPLVRLTSIVVDALLNNSQFVLNGSGKDRRSIIYVEDVVSAIKKAMIILENDIYNIAGKEEVTLLDIIKAAEDAFAKQLSVKVVNVEKEPVDIIVGGDKAKRNLGFQPQFTLKEGMKLISQQANAQKI